MIIDFSAKNFRSYKTEQRISLVASNYDKDLPQNLIDPKLPGLENVKLLKGLAIYGANAAGKTNTLLALRFLSYMVEHSATELEAGDPTGVEPFLLDAGSSDEPTEFALRFVVEGVRYHFALVLNAERILFESISAFPKGYEQVWYEREWNDDTKTYDWRPDRPTTFKRDSKIVEFTRDNALFLSTAVKWNNKDLEPIYRWFRQRLKYLRLNAEKSPHPGFTAKVLNKDANSRALILQLLRHADIGILSAEAKERDWKRNELPGDMPDEVVEEILKAKNLEIRMGHRGEGGKEFPLPWEDQSSGTQKFFSLAGPWLDLLANGYVAELDEIESSMHPAMVTALLRLVFSEQFNPHGAQLLFTTHNPLLLDPTLLRRDQIWFVDKDDEGASHLYPLSDYKPRKGESLARGYLSGRYGAVPFIPSGLLGKETVIHGS